MKAAPLLTALLFALLSLLWGQNVGAQTTIDFENHPVGTEITNQYAGLRFGVYGTRAPIIIDPPVATRSGAHALASQEKLGTEFVYDPIRVSFTVPKKKVTIYVGLIENYAQAVQVELAAYDAQNQLLAVTGPVSLGINSRSITFRVERTFNNQTIYSVKIETYMLSGGVHESVQTVIDDLIYEDADAPPPPDNTPPVVQINLPQNGATYFDRFLDVAFTVTEATSIVETHFVHDNGAALSREDFLNLRGSAPNWSSPANIHVQPFLGANRVQVTATDLAGNVGEDVIEFTFTEIPPPPATIDIFARFMEVTQAINGPYLAYDFDLNSPPLSNTHTYGGRGFEEVSLVADKPTIVRLYAGVQGTNDPVENVPALLYGRRNGVELSGSPLRPVAGPGMAPGALVTLDPASQWQLLGAGGAITSIRDTAASSWVFELPPEWTTAGEIDLEGLVNSGQHGVTERAGKYDVFNSYFLNQVSFSNVAGLLVAPVWVRVQSGGTTLQNTENAATRNAHLTLLQKLYPLDPTEPQFLSISPNTVTIRSDLQNLNKELDLLDRLEEISDENDLEDLWTPGNRKLVLYGIVPSLAPLGLAKTRVRGIGTSDPPVAFGSVDDQTDAPHEIGHALGLKHASSCNGAQDAEDWPVVNAGLQGYGFDVTISGNGFQSWDALQAVIIPGERIAGPCNAGTVESHDFMSYLKPYWASRRNWGRLFDRLGGAVGEFTEATRLAAGAGEEAVAPTSAQMVYILRGIISPSDITPSPIYHRLIPSDKVSKPEAGDFRILFRNAAGTILYTDNFAGSPVSRGESRLFSRHIPLSPDITIAQVDFYYRQNMLKSVKRSSGTPKVTIESPKGGEVLSADGSATIKWRASDADQGSQLYFNVYASADSGRTYRILAHYVADDHFILHGADLPGTTGGKIKILVTDGFNSSEDTSNGYFTVEGKAPEVVISYPFSPFTTASDYALRLEGQAYDPEDGVLSDRALRWHSSLDGFLGYGNRIVVKNLKPSTHKIWLEAEDSDHNKPQAEMFLSVIPAPQPNPNLIFPQLQPPCSGVGHCAIHAKLDSTTIRFKWTGSSAVDSSAVSGWYYKFMIARDSLMVARIFERMSSNNGILRTVTMPLSDLAVLMQLTVADTFKVYMAAAIANDGLGQIWPGPSLPVLLIGEGFSTRVEEAGESERPDTYALHQNYPNPFNAATMIAYDLPEKAKVILTLYNTLGQRVKVLVDEIQEPGKRRVQLDAIGLASGIYFYQIKAGEFVSTKKLLLLK